MIPRIEIIQIFTPRLFVPVVLGWYSAFINTIEVSDNTYIYIAMYVL